MTQLVITYEQKDILFNIDGQEVWLSQKQIAQLFNVTVPTINEHIKNILKDDEMDDSVIRKFRITADDGKSYNTNHYNLDMIIAVGYRVNSKQGTQFRKWSTAVLSSYIREGVVVNQNNIDAAANSIRAIRTSEQSFSKKILAIFANSSDYDPKTQQAQNFFATVQNKLHYATHSYTAAELIATRAEPKAPNMGLHTFKGKSVTLADARIAKNYMTELELKLMANLTEQFLLFAESTEIEGRTLTMAQWIQKLNAFIRLNDKLVLQSKGTVSRTEAEQIMRDAYAQFKNS